MRQPEHMLSVEEALGKILGLVSVLAAEERPVLESLGQVLAEDVTSPLDIPPLANSAMDGYAVRAQDVAAASAAKPVVLKVIGQVAAGQVSSQEVAHGTAIRIMTGAAIPAGADTVVPFEDTDEVRRRTSGLGLDEIAILVKATEGRHVRPAGEDVRRGEVVLEKGTIVRPQVAGVLASVGRMRVRVVRRPRVAVLSTGDELVSPGAPLGPGQIYDSNSYSVAAAVVRAGGVPLPLGIARDTLEELEGKVQRGLEADLLITSAGVSKGDYDMVKDVLARLGRVTFWSVRMKPAKPLAFGLLQAPEGRQVPHLGLPGNPVSALVAMEVVGRPAIMKMMGHRSWERPVLEAIMEEPIVNNDGRRVYARAWVYERGGVFHARLAGPQGSNILTSMVRANALAICPEDVPEVKRGHKAKVILLDY